jgi:putative NADH-flavin reductase
MNHKLKLAVIGGTGKSGKYVVEELLRQEFHFKLLLRNPENFTLKSPLIQVVKGDARDYDSILELVSGCDAVISTLGQPRGETSIFSTATANIIRAMSQFKIDRYIVTTGLNVDAPGDKKSAKTQAATEWMKTNYRETTLDKQLELDMLSGSNLRWTMVRLPIIDQTNERGKLLVSVEDCPGDKISSTDLACFLIEQLSEESFVRKAPFIATA